MIFTWWVLYMMNGRPDYSEIHKKIRTTKGPDFQFKTNSINQKLAFVTTAVQVSPW